MAIDHGYTDLATIKSRLAIGDTASDTELEELITAVSRGIDDFCKRRFYTVTETREYSPVRCDWLKVDDFISVTSLKTDDDGDGTFETTWDAADYWIEPANAQLESQPRPYYLLRARPYRTRVFPIGHRLVQLEAAFGFSSTTPPVVREACLLQTYRLAHRKEAVYAVLENPDMGAARIPRLDPDVMEKLDGVKLRRAG